MNFSEKNTKIKGLTINKKRLQIQSPRLKSPKLVGFRGINPKFVAFKSKQHETGENWCENCLFFYFLNQQIHDNTTRYFCSSNHFEIVD